MTQQLDKNMHILIVDDQEPARLLTRFCLIELGFINLHEVADGLAAMKYVAEAHKADKPVQLILCDHEMPEVDGFAFFRTLKATEECADIPFVMVTSQVLGQKIVQFVLGV